MIKTIVFIVDSFFSARDYIRFGVDTLKRNGFKVVVIDLTPLLAAPNNHQVAASLKSRSFPNHILIDRKQEFSLELASYRNDSFIISLVHYSYETSIIYREISKYKIPYGIISMSVPYSAKVIGSSISLFDKLINLRSKLNYSHLVNYCFNHISNDFLRVMSPAYVFLTGENSSTNLKLVGKKTEFVWIHSLDYDNYLASQSLKLTKKHNYAVFLDQNLPFHTDFAKQGVVNPFEPDLYYSELTKVFDVIEKVFGLDVVIAAHPGANMEVLSQYFKNRDIIANETVNIVSDAALCITHWSYSINFAILYKKPIIFLTSSTIKKYDLEWLIDSYSSCLDLDPIDMSGDIDLDKGEVLSISKDRYEQYKRLYIKTDNSPEVNFWDVVSSVLSSKSIK